MNCKLILSAILITLLGSGISAQASGAAVPASPSLAQAQPSAKDILDLCVQNRAETLPNPYVDLDPTHWAYKAVLTLYYCGAYRQATPANLIERSRQQPSPSQS